MELALNYREIKEDSTSYFKKYLNLGWSNLIGQSILLNFNLSLRQIALNEGYTEYTIRRLYVRKHAWN
jgi:hypothetical protein